MISAILSGGPFPWLIAIVGGVIQKTYLNNYYIFYKKRFFFLNKIKGYFIITKYPLK
jgi:hypothetical protein